MNHVRQTTRNSTRAGLRWPQLVLIVIVTILVTAGVTYWALGQTLFQKEFSPVQLKPDEAAALRGKLRTIGIDTRAGSDDTQPLEPEPYSEAGASRDVSLSERELNALLANNTDLARRLAIDLSDDLVSARLLIPLEEDFPVLGGNTLRVNAGVELAFRDGRPVVVLKGISLMGVALPNAWLGNVKNVDLVREFGGDPGFWKSFADGVDYMRVEDGQLHIRLKE